MPCDLSAEPAKAIELCRASHVRLGASARRMTDARVRSPSRLPGWTIGHVLTHIARNADGHVRRLEGALRGEDVARYPGGLAQRQREIADGSGRAAAEIVADLVATQHRLEDVWGRSEAAGWPHAELRADDRWPTTASPVRRLREVEVHHVDLGVGYEPSDWPEDYVAWEMPELLATVPGRLQERDVARELVAWLAGRGSIPATIELDPW